MASNPTGYITDVVYTDNYYEQLSPVTLNYLAGLNGRSPRDLDNFDYCELGCGGGLSLLVHAATHPGGRFVGIDLNPEHIASGQRVAAAAGIDNLTLIAEPVSDELAASDLPAFDFIVLHGLYAWVPESVRAVIRRFIDARLKPGGLVLVSYNARPGCTAREPLRDIMRRFALPLSQNSLERAELGLSYLRVMLNAQVPFFRLNPELARYAETLFERDLHYIAHEFFNDHWNPLGVDQVAGEMGEIGLDFAGTLPLWQNHPEADVPENLAGLFSAQTERIAREVHKDFIYNTVFRTDMYFRPDAGASTNPGRTDALWHMPFSAVVSADAVELSAQRGALRLPLNTRESRVLFGLLQEMPRSPAQLAAHPSLAQMAPAALVEAICWWVLSGQVRPVADPAPGVTNAGMVNRLNHALLIQAMHEPKQEKSWLCSQRFGTAFSFDKTQALALCALSDTSASSPALALHDLMQESGLSVEEDGVAMSEAALIELADQLFDEMEAGGTLETARGLGIIA